MQPFISPHDLKVLHEQLVRAELQRHEHGDGPGILAGIRALAVRVFSPRDRGAAPAQGQYAQPSVPIILHDGRRRVGELETETETSQAA